MKYPISIITLVFLVSCGSKTSETILHNEILNGSISNIYESRYQPIITDTTNTENYTYAIIDSSFKVINTSGLEESHNTFAFQNNFPVLTKQSAITYKKDVIQYGQDFYPQENRSFSFVVQEHNPKNRPTLIQAIIGNKIAGYSKIQYNDNNLAIENVSLAQDNLSKQQQTTTEYNEKNHPVKIIMTNLLTGLVSTTTFEYLEYDEQGNWTSRKEYLETGNPPLFNYRKYDYYK